MTSKSPEACEEAVQRYVARQIEEREEADRQNTSKRTWKIIGEIQGKTPSNPVAKVKAPDGSVIKLNREHMDEWIKYFATLLNAPPVSSTRDISATDYDLPIETDDYSRGSRPCYSKSQEQVFQCPSESTSRFGLLGTIL